MTETAEAMNHWLRLAAAVFGYEKAMRSHIVERMEEVFGEDATEQIVNCLPEEDQHDFRMLENTGNPVAISAFVRVSDFPRIVNAHKETFPFNNRQRSHIRDAVRIRNDFAHPAGKSFQQERVERQLRLLTGLIRKIDPAADGAAQEWERRLLMADENASHGLTADRKSAPNSDEPVAELRASLRAAVDEIRAAPAQPDAGAIAQQLSDALTPQLNVLRSRLDETREARAAELREALAAATENMDESRLLLEAARQDRERARQEREEARRFNEEAQQQGTSAMGGARRARAVTPDQRSQTPANGRDPSAGTSATPTDIQHYRDRFAEARNGNGWRWMTLHDGWWLTRWVGKSRSGQRACVWAPEKKEESGWIKAGKPLMNESADDEEAAFGLLYDAERSGTIIESAKQGIAEHEASAPRPDDIDDVPL